MNISIGVNKFSRMPGNITVLQTVPAFGMGFNRWFSVFFQIAADEHIHVDQPSQLSLSDATLGFPQYRNTIYRSILPGTGIAPAYVEDFPFASHNGGGVGELDLGFKIGLLSEKRGKPFSLSLRNDFFIPTSSGLSDLLRNEVQYGRFNYGIGLEASKTILHNSMLLTFNWSYRFRPGEKFSTIDLLNLPGPPTAPTPISPAVLNLSDEMGVGAGMLVFPGKRFQIITEYTGLIYVRSGIQNTTFGGRDPVDTTTGIRFYPIRRIALDVGYRYSLSLLNHQDRNGFIVKLAGAYWPEKPREPDELTSSCSVDKSSVVEGSNAAVKPQLLPRIRGVIRSPTHGQQTAVKLRMARIPMRDGILKELRRELTRFRCTSMTGRARRRVAPPMSELIPSRNHPRLRCPALRIAPRLQRASARKSRQL